MSSSSVPISSTGQKPPSKRPVAMFVKNNTYTPPPSTTFVLVEDFNAKTQTINPHLDPHNDTNGFKCVDHSRPHSQKSKVQDYSKDLSEESSHEEDDD